MKRLSVIVPGYNTRKEWWGRCVASIRKALTAADEIIVIDDGSVEKVEGGWWSVDGGRSLVDGGGGRRCEIRVIRLEKNSGLPTARNKGLEVAQGKYVTFVDSDDEVREETYARCVSRLEETGADLAVYGVQSIFVDFKLTAFDIPEDKYYGALTPKDVAYLVKRRLFYYSWNKVFRRSFIDQHNLWFDAEGVPCEDAIFNVGCVANKAKWVTVAYPGYVYYRYDGSLLSCYKPTLVAGMNKCSAAWKAYKDATPGAYDALGQYDERSEETVAGEQWTNIWRRRSPYGLTDKWRWLTENQGALLGNSNCSKVCLSVVFLKKAIFMFARAYFYIKPIRKWWQLRCNTKRGAKFEKLEF